MDYPSVLTKNFRKAIRALYVAYNRRDHPAYPDLITYRPELTDEDDRLPIDINYVKKFNGAGRIPKIPDAFLIDFNTQMVVVFEVEDSHPLSEDDLSIYFDCYLEIDEILWGLAIIRVSRWGIKTPIPLFNYNFHHMIDFIPENTGHQAIEHQVGKIRDFWILSEIKSNMDIEHKYTEAACMPERDWNTKYMFDLVSDARRCEESVFFWSEPQTKTAFETIMRQR